MYLCRHSINFGNPNLYLYQIKHADMLSDQIQMGKDFYRNSSGWVGSQKIYNGVEGNYSINILVIIFIT